eukprot:1156108-Pelagomonas_calceolata.AAC.1
MEPFELLYQAFFRTAVLSFSNMCRLIQVQPRNPVLSYPDQHFCVIIHFGLVWLQARFASAKLPLQAEVENKRRDQVSRCMADNLPGPYQVGCSRLPTVGKLSVGVDAERWIFHFGN